MIGNQISLIESGFLCVITRKILADLLAIVSMSGRNFNSHVGVDDVDVVVKPPAPLRARPIAGCVEVEFRISVRVSESEVTFCFRSGFFGLVEGLEDVDGLGEVVVPHEVDDVFHVGPLVIDVCVWNERINKTINELCHHSINDNSSFISKSFQSINLNYLNTF